MINLSLTSFGLGFPAQHARVKTTLSIGKKVAETTEAVHSSQLHLFWVQYEPTCVRQERLLVYSFLFSSDSSQPGFLRFRVGLLGGLGVMFGIWACFPVHKVTKINSLPAVRGGSQMTYGSPAPRTGTPCDASQSNIKSQWYSKRKELLDCEQIRKL